MGDKLFSKIKHDIAKEISRLSKMDERRSMNMNETEITTVDIKMKMGTVEDRRDWNIMRSHWEQICGEGALVEQLERSALKLMEYRILQDYASYLDKNHSLIQTKKEIWEELSHPFNMCWSYISSAFAKEEKEFRLAWAATNDENKWPATPWKSDATRAVMDLGTELTTRQLIEEVHEHVKRNKRRVNGVNWLIRKGEWYNLATQILRDLKALDIVYPPSRSGDKNSIKLAIERFRDRTLTVASAIGYALSWALNTDTLGNIWPATQLGFGALNTRTIITGGAVAQSGTAPGIWVNSLLANSLQPILSFLYLIHNSRLTAILAATEWDSYGSSTPVSKSLRVSGIPRGKQRGTYFLQLPSRYAVPLMYWSAMLHWFASQSLFTVSLILDGHGTVFTCGYSPTALLFLFAAFAVPPVFLLWMALRRFKNGVPVAGSSSAAIAAACHLPGEGDDGSVVAEGLLEWGVRHEQTGGGRNQSRYCRLRPTAVPFLEEGVAAEAMAFERWKEVVQRTVEKEGLPACRCCRRGK
ncbi:hypothetical protein DBV05_g8008 [Lasiodiplodia theobromae]|uniref:Uncharacterized protein n=1 Tax=Lasiodiplodia theobromae TaxID=45133 RepID=A0A5N5D6T4_9PEZI|nr:hypothetical protein DBV05_g8008 [Lasiodiplodia theobromae]